SSKPASAPVEVRGGATGVELRWREPLAAILHVVDSETGEAIEAMRVSAGFEQEMKVFGMSVPFAARTALPKRDFPGGEVTLDDLSIPEDGPPRLAITITAHGYATWSETKSVPAEGLCDLGVARLERAPVVRVRVLTDASEAPVVGAKVRIVAPKQEEGARSIGINASATVDTSSPDFAQDDGEPGLDIDVGGESTTSRSSAVTDANGIAEITVDDLETGVILVEHDDFAHAATQPFELPRRGTVEREVRLVEGGEALVRVVDSHGVAVEGAKIDRTGVVDGDEESMTTDADGIARCARLTPGVHEFALVDEPVTGGIEGIHIDLGALQSETRRGTEAVIVDGRETRVELVKPSRCTVLGTISLDGQPLEGARVRVGHAGDGEGLEAEALDMVGSMLGGMFGGMTSVEDSSRAKTDGTGAYELKNVVVGPARIIVSHRDLVMPVSTDVELVEGDNRHDLALRSTSIRGRVIGSDGEPLRGARVTIAVASDERTSEVVAGFDQAEEILSGMFGASVTRGVRTDDEGRFELRGVEPGRRLLLRFNARQHIARSLVVEPLAAGDARDDVSVRMAAAGRVSVRAAGVDHAIGVKAEWIGDPTEPTPGDLHGLLKNGRTTLDGLAPGRWRLSLETTSQNRALPSRDVEVVAGETLRVEW
ncbi:MAG: carboxypeptidase regulatory-like domain-containing protein, partial [Planctomycetes bacterium]|nr:carboxypeptidase regulatory-like domain-containing protein [Planctomycetota bacterium]